MIVDEKFQGVRSVEELLMKKESTVLSTAEEKLNAVDRNMHIFEGIVQEASTYTDLPEEIIAKLTAMIKDTRAIIEKGLDIPLQR